MSEKPAEADVPGTLLPKRQLIALFGALMVTMFMAALDQSIVGTALPTIVGDLQGMDEYTWVVTAYLVALTATTPLYGKLSDQFGRRRVIVTAIVIFLIASALAGISQNMWQLVVFRGLQGIGAGGLMTLSFTIVSDVVSPRARGKYLGYFGGVFAVSSVLGPVLGGFFADFDWRWIFYINIPLGVVAVLAVNSVLARHPAERRGHKIDILGAALLVPAVVSLMLALTWGGGTYAWSSPTIITLLVAAAVLTVAFIVTETRASEPILPLRMFRKATFSLAALIAFIFGVSMFAGMVYIPLFLQSVRGYSPTQAGLMLLPMAISVVASSVVVGQLTTKTGRYKPFLVAGSVVTTVGLGLFSQVHVDIDLTVGAAYLVVLGVGMGMFMQPLVLAMQNIVSVEDLGAGTATNNFARSLGGAVGTTALGAVMNSTVGNRLEEQMPAVVQELTPEQLQQMRDSGFSGGDLESPAVIDRLPGPVQEAAQLAFTDAMDRVFLVAASIAVVSVILTLFLPDLKLRGDVHTPKPSDDKARADDARATKQVLAGPFSGPRAPPGPTLDARHGP
ncbi:MDR family MFS transporter [Salininema proteolyticum]|uniref:MDR family MFS transporter n=1 Tax=Salininema proteolyticum TaxID=1607685 RepID=A0ABV8U0G3_9ACTN